jgi:hypothetical protein
VKPLLFAAVLTLCTFSTSLAADVVVAGQITSFSKESGTLTLLPEDRANTPMVFVNMDKAPVVFATGGIGTLHDLQPGRGATIHHTVAGNRFIVSRIVLSAPTPAPVVPAVELPSAEKRALQGKAANDGDITTQPGSKARIDRDITTQPAKKDALDRDITKKAPDSANVDRDITTNKDSR